MGEEDLKIFLSHTKNATVSSLHDKDIDFVGTPFSRESNVGYVVDLSYVPKCGSFNPYGNEQMNEGTQFSCACTST